MFPKDNEETAGMGNGSEDFQGQYSFYLSFMCENIAAKSGWMKTTKQNVKRRKSSQHQLITTYVTHNCLTALGSMKRNR